MKLLLTAAAVCGIAGVANAGTSFHFTTGFSGSVLVSVSNEGTAVGSYATEHAIWNPVGGIQMGIGGSVNGQPGISDNGQFIGGSAPGPDGRIEMGRYDRNTGMWTTFGGTGGYSGSVRSSAWGISPDGSSVVGFGYGTPTGTGTFTGIHPAAWTDGAGMVDYAFNPTATSVNRVQAMSNNGVAAGIARYPTSSSVSVGVYWTSGPGTEQGMAFSTGFLGESNDVSADGRFIAGHGSTLTRDTATPPASRPYIYDSSNGNVLLIESIAGMNGNDGVTGIGSIDGLMTGITADADTAVGFFRGRNTFGTPLVDKVWGYIWTDNDGVVPFDTFAASLGAPGTDEFYYVPTAISNDGTVIAGYRFRRSGTPLIADSFMFTNVPAPSTLAILGMPVIFGRRRR